MKIDKNHIVPDRHCPTWKYSYSGIRKFLAMLYIPVPIIEISFLRFNPIKKYLRRDKERVFYQMGETTICSYENYSFIMKGENENN